MVPKGLPLRPLGSQGLHAAAQGLGCMGLSKGAYDDESKLGTEEDRIRFLRAAFGRGLNLLSTADLYGPFENHVLIGALYWLQVFRIARVRHAT